MTEPIDEFDTAILSPTLTRSLAETLREQAGHLLAEARKAGTFQKPFTEGVAAIGKAATNLADLVDAAANRHAARNEDELMDVRAFIAAAEQRIDDLARERAAAMVPERTLDTCPACGAHLGTAGAA